MKRLKNKEIKKEADGRYGNAFKYYKDAFIKGAKWYRKQLKNEPQSKNTFRQL